MGTFDFFTPLGQIGQNFVNNYDEGQRRETLADLGKRAADPNADYRALAGEAIGLGRDDLGAKFLELSQKQTFGRGDAQAGGELFGGGSAPPRSLADLGAPAPVPASAPLRSRPASLDGMNPAGFGDVEGDVAPLRTASAAFRPQIPASVAAPAMPLPPGLGPTDLQPEVGMNPTREYALRSGLGLVARRIDRGTAPMLAAPSVDAPVPPPRPNDLGQPVDDGSGIEPSSVRQGVSQAGAAPPSTVAAAPANPRDPSTWQNPSDVPPAVMGSIEKMSLGKLVEILSRPNVSQAFKDNVVKPLYAAALNRDDKLPENIKTFMWARANGQHLDADGRPMSYKDFTDRNQKDRDDAGEKIGKEVAARRQAAAELGIDPSTDIGRRYVATGQMPSPRDAPLSASDRKAIQDADDAVVSAQNAITAMGEAKRLSAQAYAGPTATLRGKVTSVWGSEAGQATTDLGNVTASNALGQLKSIFGGNPTEGERKILLEIQGSADQPQAVRDRIFDRAAALAQRRLETATAKAAELRGGTYYKDGGGPTGKQQGRAPQITATGAPTTAAVAPPPAAVQMLRSDPSLAAAFDEKYGAGASRSTMGR